jgi:hypothetical protein
MSIKDHLIGHLSVLRLVTHEYQTWCSERPFSSGHFSTPAEQHSPSFPAPASGETDGTTQSIAAQVWVKGWCEFTAGKSGK